jgi:hypothetical protein
MTSLTRPEAEFLLYQTEDGRTRIEVRFDGETAWLSLGQMAALFQRDKSVISRHVKNVFDEGELERASVVAESATTAADGKTYQVEYYNLLPSPVEKHFEQAVQEVKRLEKAEPSPQRPRRPRKKDG